MLFLEQRRRGPGHRHASVPGLPGEPLPGAGPARRRRHGPHGHVRAFGRGSAVPPARAHGGGQPEGRLCLHPHHFRHGELARGARPPAGEQVCPRARHLVRSAAAFQHPGRDPRGHDERRPAAARPRGGGRRARRQVPRAGGQPHRGDDRLRRHGPELPRTLSAAYGPSTGSRCSASTRPMPARYAEEMQARHDIEAVVAPDGRSAVRGADIVWLLRFRHRAGVLHRLAGTGHVCHRREPELGGAGVPSRGGRGGASRRRHALPGEAPAGGRSTPGAATSDTSRVRKRKGRWCPEWT